MIRTLGSLVFYTRFLRSFSALGFRRRARDWRPLAPDLSGQRWVVTGATGGIGRATALAACRFGAEVIAIARSDDKLDTLRAEAEGAGRIRPLRADLSLLREVRALVDDPTVAEGGIDVLVDNVGVLLNDFWITEENLECSLATNLLGHVVLAEGLRDAGRFGDDALVIEVSSGGMYGTPLTIEPMLAPDPDDWDGMAAYAMHKRAQVALTRAWNERWQGAPTVQVMHPGWVDTEGVKTALPGFRAALKKVLRNADQGADTILWLAAERPPIPAEGGIWLDRELQPEHEFGFTRDGADVDELNAAVKALLDDAGKGARGESGDRRVR
ncbi:SDR family NAD(P)-dependent oxidoreductase [Wenzhouxiangella sp. XN79A]|uniref:SDR family NAD(P)-dependent oxidoreductase n=1 Tax=Wenzhouxiangella sp. XN79A TaxID=2724193 RepID=UPI00144A814B|nr:SDR family NAD(P)-dependent oxidoreductase [Wenzhouxiangella sp. XN79A]NKI33969.1 SDR family NAD(P)-dependent oxidoreductase [Wenzhouxiangella sp. XN79A]